MLEASNCVGAASTVHEEASDVPCLDVSTAHTLTPVVRASLICSLESMSSWALNSGTCASCPIACAQGSELIHVEMCLWLEHCPALVPVHMCHDVSLRQMANKGCPCAAGVQQKAHLE